MTCAENPPFNLSANEKDSENTKVTLAHDWFAAAQCSGSVVFELSTCLLFWRPYRLLFPALGAAFHGVIWYTLGVNYLTSVIIQWTRALRWSTRP